MAEPEGVAELVHRLLQSAAAKVLLVGVEIEPEQRDDAGFSARLGNAKDEVQIPGVPERSGRPDIGRDGQLFLTSEECDPMTVAIICCISIS
jgi:hypothetical protein